MFKEFPLAEKEEIFIGDGYRCTMCGRGVKEGAKLHIDPIRMKDKDGKIKTVSGLTLCELHTFIGEEGKETPLKMFVRLREQAREDDDEKMQSFFTEILGVYEQYGMNEHLGVER